MDGFFATGGVKRHVLFSLVNSNRGEFSDYVPNRTMFQILTSVKNMMNVVGMTNIISISIIPMSPWL